MKRPNQARPRRRYRRLTMRLQVEYVSSEGHASDPATTLGAGGLFIATEAPLPRDAPLKLRFRLPGGVDLHEIEGRVVWRKRPMDPGNHASGMGIEFTDRAAAAKLARELEKIR